MPEEDKETPIPPTFDALALSAEVRRAVDALGFTNPTPVQLAVFDPAVRGKSLVVQARTGTGKTAAFGLPLVDQLVRRGVEGVQALILTPTRELALQVGREIMALGQFRGVKVTSIYGGASMTKQIDELKAGAQIVSGTPGRVLDHLRRGTLDASHIRMFVLDEADEMLSMGFAKELHAIMEFLPKERQGLFFSATIPPDIERMAHKQLKEPEFITLSSDSIGALQIQHFVYVTPAGDKRKALVRVIEVEDPESAIIFCNTKDETERVAEVLQRAGYEAEWLNGDLEQKERERIMAATREGKLRFLVATDVAARGIDISHLTHVINADFPESAENYVHRTGRTGRAGRTGTAISMIGPKDIGALYLMRLTYKIRPIEKQLPSAQELKTRGEQDLVQMFVDAFAKTEPHPDDLALARRLLTHADAERILAGLLRDHLGARQALGENPAQQAAEARRAKNPPRVEPPVETRVEGRVEARRTEDARPPRRDRGPRPEGERSERSDRRPSRGGGRSEHRDDDNGPAVPGYRVEGESDPLTPGQTTARSEQRGPATRPSDDLSRGAALAAEERRRDGRTSGPARDDAGARRGARGRRGVPHTSFATWEPRAETDDDKPILVTQESAVPKGVAGPSDAAEMDDPDFAQIFVNVGRRDGARPDDLQRLLTEHGGIAKEDTGRIRIRDRIAFVSVRKALVEKAVAALAGQTLGGRSIVAEPARDRA